MSDPRVRAGSDRSRVRIIHVTAISCDGVAEHVATLAEGLDPARYDVTLVYSSRDVGDRFAAALGRLEASGATLISLDIPREIALAPDLRALARLSRLFRAGRYDIVHLHSSKAGFLGRLAAAVADRGAAVIYTPNAFAFQNQARRSRRWLYLALEKFAGRLTRFLICTSEGEAREARRHRLVPPARLRVIENGIDASLVLRKVDRADPAVRIGTVARLAEQKDPLTLVRAAERVCREDARVRFEWVGDGPLREQVEGALRERGLEESFSLEGLHPDPRTVLPTWDIFVLPSLYEGLPYALLEAMAAGLPAVVTDVAGNSEVVEDGRTGLVVPPGDADTLATALLRLARDPGARRAMGAASLERVAGAYRLERTRAATRALYREALGPAGGSGATEGRG